MKDKNIIKKGLNSNQLKIIAIIAMTIDHLNKTLLVSTVHGTLNDILRIIGRITIPIMCFFISEGYFHTKSKKRYIGRLFIFSIISHIPYCLAFNHSIIPKSIFLETSVIWSLLWGLIALAVVKQEKINKILKGIFIFIIFLIVGRSDWGIYSVALILTLGVTRGNKTNQMLGIGIISLSYMIMGYMENHNFPQFMHYMGLFLTIPFLINYNGEKGKCKFLKWFFYIYYPLHLGILVILRDLVLI